MLEPINSSVLQGNSTQSDLTQADELDVAMMKQCQKYYFLGNDEGSLGPVKKDKIDYFHFLTMRMIYINKTGSLPLNYQSTFQCLPLNM